MNCIEKNYGIILSIIALKDEDVVMPAPYWVLKKNISASDGFGIAADAQKIIIPLKKNSAKLSESSEDSLQGTIYTINLTWEVENLTEEGYNILIDLKNNFKHLIINTFADNNMLVCGNRDGWSFMMDDSEGFLKCSLTVKNASGIIRFVD